MSAGGFRDGPFGVFAVIWRPVRTLRDVAGGRGARQGFVVVALYAALSFVLSVFFVLAGSPRRQFERPGLLPGFGEGLAGAAEVGAPILSLLYPFAIWLSVSLSMHLATRPFGGTGPFSSMLGVVGVAQAPLLAGGALVAGLAGLQRLAGAEAAVGAALGFSVSLLSFALALWYVVLVVVGASLARNVGYGESAGACALSCVGLGILIIVLVLIAGVGVFTVAGATQG